MSKSYLLGLLFLSIPAFASNWQMTYHNTHHGSLLIDQDGIAETQGSEKKVWTLFAPRVTIGQPGEGYAYNKILHQVNCAKHTAAITQAIYYDENQIPHESIVENKSMHDIIPDSDDDFLWAYVCKPDQQEKLATPMGKEIAKFLKDQVKFTKENSLLVKKASGQ